MVSLWQRQSLPAPLATTLVLVLGLNAQLGCRSLSSRDDDCEPPCDQAELASGEARLGESVRRPVVTKVAVDDLQAAFKKAVREAGPGVVSIYSTKTVTVGGRSPFPGGDPFDLFFERRAQPPRKFQQQGLGSGFVIDAAGHVVTNNHVVEHADEIKVKLADGREFTARVVGLDPPTDLAVLKIDGDGQDFEPLTLGDSEGLEIGDWVLAIGNPFGLSQTVSSGIISAKDRANVGIVDYANFLQTDAAVNPGNSGGPLVNLDGEVVGINTAIASRSGGNNGIAFAIPVNMAKSVIEQLIDSGKVVRGHLGVVISELSSEMAESFSFKGSAGILVQDVGQGTPAEKAGLHSGDIITGLDGEPVTDVPAFRDQIAKRAPGTEVRLEIWRDGKTFTKTAALGTAVSSKDGATSSPPKIGIALQDISPELARKYGIEVEAGALITSVVPGSAAARAGVREGDVLERVGSKAVENAAQAREMLRSADLERGVRLRLIRNGQRRFVLIKAK